MKRKPFMVLAMVFALALAHFSAYAQEPARGSDTVLVERGIVIPVVDMEMALTTVAFVADTEPAISPRGAQAVMTNVSGTAEVRYRWKSTVYMVSGRSQDNVLYDPRDRLHALARDQTRGLVL